jgi:hypothetical protein
MQNRGVTLWQMRGLTMTIIIADVLGSGGVRAS